MFCAIFARVSGIFIHFAQISRDFAQIFRDYDRIFDKSKLSGVRFHPCIPAPLIKSVSAYGFNSNNHTHMFLFVTQALRVLLFESIFRCGIWVYLKSLNGNPASCRAVGTAPRTPRPGGPQPCLGAPPQLQYFYCFTFLILKIIIYISMIKCHGQLAGTGGGHQLNHPRHFVLYQGLL